MHAVAFGAKRTFHSFLRVTRRPMLEWPGLTAARFDMLSAFLKDHFQPPVYGALSQIELRRRLGVCASVVSRMVRALQERGWVSRKRDPRDRRTWRLRLTVAGEDIIRSARRLLLRVAARLVDDAFHMSPRHDRERRFRRLLVLTDWLHSILNDFGDGATLDYPWWHTDFDH